MADVFQVTEDAVYVRHELAGGDVLHKYDLAGVREEEFEIEIERNQPPSREAIVEQLRAAVGRSAP